MCHSSSSSIKAVGEFGVPSMVLVWLGLGFGMVLGCIVVDMIVELESREDDV